MFLISEDSPVVAVECEGWLDFLEKLGERKQDVCVLEYRFPSRQTAVMRSGEGEDFAVALVAEGMPLYVTDVTADADESCLVVSASESDPGKGQTLTDAQFLARASMLGGLYRKVRLFVGGRNWDVVSVKGLALDDVRERGSGIALAPSPEWKAKEVEAGNWDLSDDQPETPFLDVRFDN